MKRIMILLMPLILLGCSKTNVMVHCDEVHIHAEVNSDASTRVIDYSGICEEIQIK